MATKKPAPKKAAKPVKKAKLAQKKAASAKKVAASKSTSKKAAPAKKPSKAAPKKAAKPAPKKAAPAKKPAKVAPKKAAPKKAIPVKTAKPAPKKAAPVAKKIPTNGVPSKAAPSKAVPAKTATVVKGNKTIPAKGGKPAPGAKPVQGKAAGKKVPLISPETRFAGTSTKVASQAEIRKALRAKEATKNLKPVPMPKITTKTALKYEPEFTKSVLDSKLQVEQTGPTQRYSDAELAEFRELVQHKLNAAKQELAYLNGLITRKDSMSGGDSDSRYMTMEDGSLSMEREQLNQMASRQIDFIEKLEKAMMRIENKTYGICRVTGRLIDKARLKAVPHATLSMEAKMGMSRGGFNNANQ